MTFFITKNVFEAYHYFDRIEHCLRKIQHMSNEKFVGKSFLSFKFLRSAV